MDGEFCLKSDVHYIGDTLYRAAASVLSRCNLAQSSNTTQYVVIRSTCVQHNQKRRNLNEKFSSC